jgi:hypothetical protein
MVPETNAVLRSISAMNCANLPPRSGSLRRMSNGHPNRFAVARHCAIPPLMVRHEDGE